MAASSFADAERPRPPSRSLAGRISAAVGDSARLIRIRCSPYAPCPRPLLTPAGWPRPNASSRRPWRGPWRTWARTTRCPRGRQYPGSRRPAAGGHRPRRGHLPPEPRGAGARSWGPAVNSPGHALFMLAGVVRLRGDSDEGLALSLALVEPRTRVFGPNQPAIDLPLDWAIEGLRGGATSPQSATSARACSARSRRRHPVPTRTRLSADDQTQQADPCVGGVA